MPNFCMTWMACCGLIWPASSPPGPGPGPASSLAGGGGPSRSISASPAMVGFLLLVVGVVSFLTLEVGWVDSKGAGLQSAEHLSKSALRIPIAGEALVD